MTPHRKTNIFLMLFCIVSAIVFMNYVAGEEEKEAISSQEYVARQICGPNAGFYFQGEELTCLTKRGHKASKQTVASK